MNAILKKYRIDGSDFLVYDTLINEEIIDGRMARTFCAQNFGLNTQAILVGPIETQIGPEMKGYSREGAELTLTGSLRRLAEYLLGDDTHENEITYVGKVFVYLEFANRTHAA